jgi:hypothetical protein
VAPLLNGDLTVLSLDSVGIMEPDELERWKIAEG